MVPPDETIRITVRSQRLGFQESSIALKEEWAGRSAMGSVDLPAGQVSAPIRIRIGYRPAQAAAILGTLGAILGAIVLVTAFLCGRGLAHLQRSIFILGITFWLAAVWQLQAAELVRVVFGGTPWGGIAATLATFLPPLLGVAAGAAWGRRKQQRAAYVSREVIWSYGLFLFPLAGLLAGVSDLDQDQTGALGWVSCSLACGFWCYRQLRKMGGTRVRELTGGALRERLCEMAARAGHREAGFFLLYSTRQTNWNAFAQLGNRIVLGAALVESLTTRELDAIAAHELSHLGRIRAGVFSALAIAAVLFQTPLIDVMSSLLGGPEGAVELMAGLVVLAIFFSALRGARRREYAADAGAVALTGDPRAMIAGLARISRHHDQPLQFPFWAEWLSTHPSTENRIQAIARAARLDETEVQMLCAADFPGERYALPAEDEGAIFNLGWQASNAARYGWALALTAPTAGLAAAVLMAQIPNAGIISWIAGILIGCGLTKLVCSAVMAANYARLGRRLETKLGVSGELVGFAPGSQMRVFHGYRFPDAGFLWFEKGRLHYRSERTALDLGPLDIAEVGMVAAAPVSWRSKRPIIRLRRAAPGSAEAFILHPLRWGAWSRALVRQIEKWRVAPQEGAGEEESAPGVPEIPGESYRPLRIDGLVRGFRLSGPMTLFGAMLAGWPVQDGGVSGWYALAVAASAYLFMLLPAMRRPA